MLAASAGVDVEAELAGIPSGYTPGRASRSLGPKGPRDDMGERALVNPGLKGRGFHQPLAASAGVDLQAPSACTSGQARWSRRDSPLH